MLKVAVSTLGDTDSRALYNGVLKACAASWELRRVDCIAQSPPVRDQPFVPVEVRSGNLCLNL